MKYTVWYMKDNKKVIWATGLSWEEAELALKTLNEEFSLTAGIEEENE